MCSSLAVVRRACLVLGLLTAVGGSAWAQCTCPLNGPVVSCPALDFGSVALGGSAARTRSLTCGGLPCTISFAIVGPDMPNFVLTANACTGLQPANSSCDFTITFTPSRCGPHVAFLVITFVRDDGSCTEVVPLTGTGTFTPVPGPLISFPSACAGTNGASITLTLPANTVPSIVGPGNFSITATDCPMAASTCTVTIRFNPLAAACGTVTSTLQVTSTLTNCVLATFELSGFACSFTCAIGQAGTASLTAAGRKCVLDSLQIAANAPAGTAGQVTRCAALRCAECCALSDLALRPAGSAARASIQALLDQIHCLQACFGCAPFPC